MTQRNVLFGMAACLAVAIAVFCWQQRTTAGDDKAPKKATVWEYKTVVVDDSGDGTKGYDKVLNAEPARGWVLDQHVYRGSASPYVILRRPKAK